MLFGRRLRAKEATKAYPVQQYLCPSRRARATVRGWRLVVVEGRLESAHSVPSSAKVNPFSQMRVMGDPSVNISGSSSQTLNRRGKYLAGVPTFTKQCFSSPDQIAGSRNKSLLFGLSTSSVTRIRGARGNVRHVHERPSCELPLSRGIEYAQFQLSHVGYELYSTTGLKLAVCLRSMPQKLKWASTCPTR